MKKMIIKKIQLKNITTHEDTNIEFQEGLNVLTGNNGTGKSTILKMIGYNLFDYLPGSKKSNYIRNINPAPKSGIIKIWIVGNNDQEYLIERKIGKNKNTYQITDVNTTLELLETGSGKEQLQDWLKEQNNLDKSYELDTLFDTCIGVKQGSFTEPFLRRPSNRKKYFSEILNTDIYDKVFKNSIDILRDLEADSYDITTKINDLNVRLENKDEIEDKIKNLKIEHEEKVKSKLINDTKFKRENKQYNSLKKVKNDLDIAESNMKENQVRLDSNNKLIKKNHKELENAIKSKQICLNNKDNYLKYKSLRETLNSLEKELEKVHKIKDAHVKIQGKINSNDAKIGQFNTEIEEINKMSEKLPSLKDKNNKFKSLQFSIEEKQKEINKLEENDKQIKKKSKNASEINKEIQSLSKKLKNIDGIKELVLGLDKLENNIMEHEKNSAKLLGELKHLKKSKEQSKGGNCPFLNEKCKNIAGDSLEEHFDSEIKKIEKIQFSKNTVLNKMEEEKNLLVTKEKELKKLEKLEIISNEKQNQLKELTKEILELELNSKNMDGFKSELDKLQEMKHKLEPLIKEFNIIQEKVENKLPTLQKEVEKLKKEKTLFQKELKPLEKIITDNEGLAESIKKIKVKRENLRDGHDKFQLNHKLMERFPELEAEQKNLNHKQKKIQKSNKAVISLVNDLKQQFDIKKFTEIENKREFLMKQISKLEVLITELQKQQKELTIKLEKLKSYQKERKNLLKEQKQLENILSFCKIIRTWFKEAGTLMTEALIDQINQLASELYHELIGNNSIDLEWLPNYDINITTPQNVKGFAQLSGGEQMSAALAVRLAILKVLTNSDFAFFDEPTTNLDSEKRDNLAKCIQKIQVSKGFKQLFVISHDDTFEENADFVVRFSKDENEKTEVEYMN